MRSRDKIICFVCVLIAVGFLAAAGMQLDYINSQRRDMKLIINEPLKNAPPSLAFATVAMGAFRGLVVDILWIRADRLKEEGQYFDARQLAEWITTLQPRFAAVWEFHAWNMAYNISVAIPADQPEQRWRWVRNGYELLRDKGIPLNPKSIELYRELARIFQHKMGGVSDDAHKYYKLQLAMAMEPLLGPADEAYFDALAQATAEWAEIEKDANELIAALRSADPKFADAGRAEFVRQYLSLRQNANRFDPQAGAAIDRFRDTRTLEKFDVFARAYELRNTWKLKPELMRDLNETYGPIDWQDPNKHMPLDWRHPDTHAIYWAVRGLEVLAEQQDRELDITETNSDRMVAHSLQDLFRNGKIFIYDVPVQVRTDDQAEPQTRIAKEVFLRPDLRMFSSYNNTLLAVMDKYRVTDDEGRLESIQNGHRNFLKNALLSFYQTGHKQYAARIYEQLRKLYPLKDFEVTLDEYAKKRFREEMETLTINDAKELVNSFLREAYFLYAMHEDEESYAREKMAQDVFDFYNSQYPDEQRIDLPGFTLMRYMALYDFLRDAQFPPNLRQNLLARIEIERPDLYEQLKTEGEKLSREAEKSPE